MTLTHNVRYRHVQDCFPSKNIKSDKIHAIDPRHGTLPGTNMYHRQEYTY